MFEELTKKRRARGWNVKAIVAAILFGAIIVVFIFLDMNPGRGGTTSGVSGAAYVNNTTISLAELAEAEENLRQNPFFAQFGAQGGNFLRMQALQQLVTRELVSQEAEKQGLLVTDKEVAATITEIPVFQENGRFRRDRYLMYLQNVRKTAGDFESLFRKDLSRERTQRLFGLAVHPTDLEITKQEQIQNMKADLDFVAIATDQVVKPASIPEADVTAFLASADGAKRANDYFISKKADEFSKPEEVNVRHVLIKVDRGNKTAEDAALAKIQGIRKRLETEDFAKVAKEVSEDPASKNKGGEIGFFGRGQMVPEFEKVAFELEPKKLSEPVLSQFGYHIIQLIDKHPATESKFDDVKNGIARKLIASDLSEKKLDEIRDLLKNADAAGVDKWIQAAGLKWDTTGAFGIDSENVPKIGQNSEVADLAFALNAQKPLADKLIRQGQVAYVLRYKAAPTATGAAALTAAAKPEAVREALTEQRGRDAFSRWVSQIQKGSKISYSSQFQSQPMETETE